MTEFSMQIKVKLNDCLFLNNNNQLRGKCKKLSYLKGKLHKDFLQVKKLSEKNKLNHAAVVKDIIVLH